MTHPVPIALFAYARPDHLRQTLAALKANGVPLIYAFSDGARDQAAEHAVCEVRKVVREVDWCDIRICERKSNLGLGPSIRSGVTRVLEEHSSVIVVEDDVVLRPGAYDYTVAATQWYRDHPDVMSVSMWSHPSLAPAGEGTGFFSKRFVCWGWATWREHWEKYVATPAECYQECLSKGIPVLEWGTDIQWQVEHAADRQLWYVGYALTHFLHGGLSYFPPETLTVNIGFDGSGENTGASRKQDRSLLDVPVALPQTWPDVGCTEMVKSKFYEYFSPQPPSWRRRLGKAIHRWRRKLFRGTAPIRGVR